MTYPTNFSEAWIAANQAALEGARARYRTLAFDAVLELLLSFSRLSITAELKQITAPTLVIVGEQDILKPRKYAEIIAREIPQCEFVVVPNSGHAVCWLLNAALDQSATVAGYGALETSRALRSNVAANQIRWIRL